VSIAGNLQQVYKVLRVTPELLPLLRKGNAALADLDPDADLLNAAESRIVGGSHQ